MNKSGDETGEAEFYILVVPTEKSAKVEVGKIPKRRQFPAPSHNPNPHNRFR